MRKKIALHLFCWICFLFFAINTIQAQNCGTCSYTDPNHLGCPCNVTNAPLQGNFNICGTTTNCGSGALTYTPGLSTTEMKTLTGYYWLITGGGGTACITEPNGQKIPESQGGAIDPAGTWTAASNIAAQINWTVAGTFTLQFFGYTGWVNSAPTILSYSSVTTIHVASANSVPAEPNSIYIGAPQCSVKGYMFNVGPCASNVTSYTWTGSGSGTYPICEDGPVLIAGQWPNQAYFCVTANNSCGSSYPYCTYVNVPSTVGCYDVPSVLHSVKSATDATGNNNLKPFEIYPNPANDKFIITFPSLSNYNIQIINSVGQVVKNLMISNADTKELSVSELSAGLYFAIIKLNGNPVSQKKILIQH